ncbi:hypothetical protein [Falsibacillus albus]|nr:hypothetical protein [Falsibacillus albus]
MKKQIIFFSDGEHYQDEIAYYDALIDLKRKYPDDFRDMLIMTPKDRQTQVSVKDYPTLVIMYHQKVVLKVNGDRSKKEIVRHVSKTLDKIK